MLILEMKAFLFAALFHYVLSNVTYTPSCGLQAGIDMWTAEGTINITDTTDFKPAISIESNSEVLCYEIDLRSCSATNRATSGELCVCLANSSHVYTFLVRKTAKVSNKGELLTAEYQCGDYTNTCFAAYTVNIGTLPLIFDPPSAVYRLLGCQGREVCSGDAKKIPTESVTKTVVEKQVIQLEMCIHNLIDGVSTFNGIKSKNACTELNVVMFIGPAGTTKQVAVTFKENGGCQRTGSFTLDIRAVVNTDAYGMCEN